MKQGTIALDIDGTITDHSHMVPDEVVSYLESLHAEGWEIVLLTGRTLSFSLMSIEKFTFPYYLAIQNGADLLKMPEKVSIGRSYLSIDMVHALDLLYKDQEEDFIIYSGYENGDFCYYRPDHFSKKLATFLHEIQILTATPWKPLTSFAIEEQKSFPLIKCIGTKKVLDSFNEKLTALPGIKTSVIRDPISRELYLILITHQDADKGISLQKIVKSQNLPHPLITGGDDNNDIPLLKEGDIRIAMENSPLALQNLADIIAKPSNERGIIKAIEEAINRIEKGR